LATLGASILRALQFWLVHEAVFGELRPATMIFDPPTAGEMSTSVFGFFGLRENPFSINPNPRFLYLTPLAHSASQRLLDGIRDRKGLILLTGEVGTGKTLLLRRLLDWLTEQKMPTALIFNSHVNPDHLLDFILSDFGVRCDSDLKSDKLIALNNWLLERFRAGQTPVLVIDEAQGLPLHALEEVRLLLNLETPRQKLLQVVLAGQPELEEKLRRHELRQLRQRITVRCRTAPLTVDETLAYVQSRLRTAGATQPVFQPEAAAAVHAYARGIPRVINLLCEHSLINACAESCRIVTPEFVERAAHDCQLDQIESVSRLLNSNYPASSSSDEISSIFAGMSFAEGAPLTQAHASFSPDSHFPPETFASADPDAGLRMHDSWENSSTTSLADPFLQSELPPSTDLSAFGEYPAAAANPSPLHENHTAYDQRSSSGNGNRALAPKPLFNPPAHQQQVSTAYSQSPTTRSRVGMINSTGSLFQLWWKGFAADARYTARQLYAVSRSQVLKLKPYALQLGNSLQALHARTARFAADSRWQMWHDRVLIAIQQTYAKISTEGRNRLAQLSAKAKARLTSSLMKAQSSKHDPELARHGSVGRLRRWLRKPLAPTHKPRHENRPGHGRRNQAEQ
jgi:general secretion pathway protein A